VDPRLLVLIEVHKLFNRITKSWHVSLLKDTLIAAIAEFEQISVVLKYAILFVFEMEKS
jgi:hypothetical protein